MQKFSWIFIAVAAVLFACGENQNASSKDTTLASGLTSDAPNELADGLYAVIQTNKGNITCRLEYERAPATVANFVGLAEGTLENTIREAGESYYDNIVFHRVVPNFVIQAGDPNTLEGGNPAMIGRGGPGHFIQTETHPELKQNTAGTLAMANMGAGTQTNGSQFYITHRPTPELDGGYSVFGYVVRDLKNVYQIAQGDTIRHIEIVRKGEAAEAYDAVAMFNQHAQVRKL